MPASELATVQHVWKGIQSWGLYGLRRTFSPAAELVYDHFSRVITLMFSRPPYAVYARDLGKTKVLKCLCSKPCLSSAIIFLEAQTLGSRTCLGVQGIVSSKRFLLIKIPKPISPPFFFFFSFLFFPLHGNCLSPALGGTETSWTSHSFSPDTTPRVAQKTRREVQWGFPPPLFEWSDFYFTFWESPPPPLKKSMTYGQLGCIF